MNKPEHIPLVERLRRADLDSADEAADRIERLEGFLRWVMHQDDIHKHDSTTLALWAARCMSNDGPWPSLSHADAKAKMTHE